MVPEGWTPKLLGELYTFKNGFNTEIANYGEGTKFVNVMDIFSGDHLTHDRILGRVKINTSTAEAYGLRFGDVLFNRTSETFDEIAFASVYMDDLPAIFGGFVIRARPTNGAIDAAFSRYLFKESEVRRQLIRRGQGAIRANIGQSDLADVPVVLPPLPEQKRIAEILSTWDAAIETTEKLLANAEQQKRALMQQLLTGKSVRSWETKPLGELFSVQLGKMLNKKAKAGKSQRPYLTNIDVRWGAINVGDLNEMHFSEEECRKYRLEPGDLLVCEGGEIGRCAIWEHNDFECYYQKALHRLRPISDEVSSRFLYLFFEAANAAGLLRNYAARSSIAHLTRERILTIPVPVPAPSEQTRIVGMLSAAEELRMALARQASKLIKEKSSLVTALLSGKRRVTV